MCLVKKKKEIIQNVVMKSRIHKLVQKNMQIINEKLKQKFESSVTILGEIVR